MIRQKNDVLIVDDVPAPGESPFIECESCGSLLLRLGVSEKAKLGELKHSLKLKKTKKEGDDMESNTKTGVVTHFNVGRGFGFISEQGTSVSHYTHYTSLARDEPRRFLSAGQTVEFVPWTAQKGPAARDVRVLVDTDREQTWGSGE